MSRHYFDCHCKGQPVQVVIGYDRALREFFLQIVSRHSAEGSDDSSYLYASIADPAFCGDLEACREVLEGFGIVPPESVLQAVRADAEGNVGNLVIRHFADGSSRQLFP